MLSTLAVDRVGALRYLGVSGDIGVAAEGDGGELPVGWGTSDAEDEIDIEVRGGGFLRKLGRRLGPAGSMRTRGTNTVEPMVVASASTTTNVEVEPLLVVSEPLLVLEVMVDRSGREPDGSEDTGGMRVASCFIGCGVIFTASSDPNSTDPDLLSSLDDVKCGDNDDEDPAMLTLAVWRSDGGADWVFNVIANWVGDSDGVLGICLTEFRLLIELEGVKVGTTSRGLSLWPIMGGAAVYARLLDREEESTREDG
jgi:hypothetical protein